MRLGSRQFLSAASVLVFLGISAVSVVLSLWLQSGVRAERESMLDEKTHLAALVVSNLFDNVGQDLSYLDSTTAPGEAPTAAFAVAAKKLAGPESTIAVVRPQAGRYTVLESTGPRFTSGQILSGPSTTLITQALASPKFVAGLVHTGSTRQLAFALRSSQGLVIYQVYSFDMSQAFRTGGTNNPFSDLRGALYASPTADPAQLIMADTTHIPIRGQVEQQTLDVGSSRWLVVAAANGPLLGSISAAAPWGALGAGLLVAILVAGIMETLARRRRYALALADQRTHELQGALARQGELERKEREARQVAEAANRSKSEFLSRMSHELRTPLNAVLGFGQLLEIEDLDETQRESVTQIVKGGRHLLGLINDVLDISRIETGNLALSVEPVPAVDLLQEVLTLMRPLAAGQQIELIAAVSGSTTTHEGHVLADHQRLKQVLLNLVSNAIKYNRSGGTVTVSLEAPTERRVRLVVADTGPGIPPENADRLFVPFERLGAERTDIEGTGVGLALSRRLAEAMGGTLDFESVPGRGSRFWIDLPGADDPLGQIPGGSPDSADHGPDDPAGPEARRKILYIEDNPPNIRLVERILARREHLEVVPAMQGRLGLALAEEHQPELILLDLHLPDIGGDEVLRQLQANPATSGIPVVVLSADATSHQIERLLSQGATRYLTKPINVHELLDVVDQTLVPGSPQHQ